MQGKRKDFKSFKFLFFFVFCLIFTSFVYTYQITFAQEPANKELNILEEKVFHQIYNSESIETRISRLENFLFGGSSSKDSIEVRLKKITTALKAPEIEQPVIKAAPQLEEIKPEIPDQIPSPQEAIDKEGIIGAINQIEMKMFNMTFNDHPFPARISALEDRLLSKREILVSRTKPLLERVTILVDKAGLPVQKDTMLNIPVIEKTNTNEAQIKNAPKSYSIDPNTGLLIDEAGQIAMDADGNPISVMLPQQLPQQALPNYGYQPPQGNPLQQNQFPGQVPPGQLPYDLFFNQGGGLTDPGY